MSVPLNPVKIVPPGDKGGISIELITEIVGWIGTAIGIALNITPVILFYKIIRKIQTIKIIPESMLVFNVVCSLLWFCYWFRLDVFVAGFSALIGAILSVIFSIIFVYFLADGNIWKWLLYSFVILDLVVQMFYVFVYMIPDPGTTGFIAMIINIINYGAPGQNLILVIKSGDHNMIPIYTVLAATACSISWLTFGLLKMDINCIVPNSIGLVLSTINLIVWAVFYCKGGKGDGKGDEKKEMLADETKETEDAEKSIN